MSSFNPEDKNIHTDLEDWIDALENLELFNGNDYTKQVVNQFIAYIDKKNLIDDIYKSIPFENTISHYDELNYPGDWDIEEKIRHFIRWNALIMVLKANKEEDLGGHISTYASAATLYEVGFNHFFKGADQEL